MKIYLVYRTAYIPNSRYIKSFEADSLLAWFQENWEAFYKDENDTYVRILGIKIYGFPIWKREDDKDFPTKPNDLEDLKTKIDRYIYSNEVIAQEDCLQVYTDDDEIELAWAVFTEKYQQENWDKVSLWFHQELPTRFGEKGKDLPTNYQVLPSAKEKGTVYFLSCPIYDGGNLSDLEGACKIEGLRLPELLDYLQTHEITFQPEESYTYSNELKFIQHLVKESKANSFKEVLELASTLPITEIEEEDKSLSLEKLLKLKLRNAPEKSILKTSEHFYEVCINGMSLDDFIDYNYWVFFDDLWIEANESLAKSLINFASNELWKV